MYKDNFNRLGFNGLQDNRNNFDFMDRNDFDRKEIITDTMRKDVEMLKMFGNRNKLMEKPVYYVDGFRADNADGINIIRGPQGTFYLDPRRIPKGVHVERAYFSYTVGGDKSGSCNGMYLVVEGDSGFNVELTRKIVEFDNEDELMEIYHYLTKKGRNISLNGNKIIINSDEYIVNTEIIEFKEKYKSKVDEYQDYLQSSKYEDAYVPTMEDDDII